MSLSISNLDPEKTPQKMIMETKKGETNKKYIASYPKFKLLHKPSNIILQRPFLSTAFVHQAWKYIVSLRYMQTA